MMFVKRSNQCQCTVLSIIITMESIVNPIKSYSQTNYSVKMPEEASTILQTPVLEHRIAIEQVKNPYWHEKHGQNNEVRIFWDRDIWDRNLREWASYGYNGIFYYVEPWQETQWPRPTYQKRRVSWGKMPHSSTVWTNDWTHEMDLQKVSWTWYEELPFYLLDRYNPSLCQGTWYE